MRSPLHARTLVRPPLPHHLMTIRAHRRLKKLRLQRYQTPRHGNSNSCSTSNLTTTVDIQTIYIKYTFLFFLFFSPVDDDRPHVDATKLSTIRMKLEEKRRQIEQEKRRMEIALSKQQQKVGKAAFLQAINKVSFDVYCPQHAKAKLS